MSYIDPSQYYGKNLIVDSDTKAYLHADKSSAVYKSFKSGADAGVVFSSIENGQGTWLEMNVIDSTGFDLGQEYWILLNDISLNDSAMSAQGVKSMEQIAQENAAKNADENSHWYDGIVNGFSQLGSVVKWGLILVIVFIAAKYGIQAYNQIKRRK